MDQRGYYLVIGVIVAPVISVAHVIAGALTVSDVILQILELLMPFIQLFPYSMLIQHL